MQLGSTGCSVCLGKIKTALSHHKALIKAHRHFFKKSGENIKSCSWNVPVNVLAHLLYECQLGFVKGACFVVALHIKPQASGVPTNHLCFQSFSRGSRRHTGTRPFITLAQSIGSLHKAICNYSQLADMNLFKIGMLPVSGDCSLGLGPNSWWRLFWIFLKVYNFYVIILVCLFSAEI